MISRRSFFTFANAGVAVALTGCAGFKAYSRQEVIVDGLRAALKKSLLPALLEKAYPGHFTISSKAQTYGIDNTWPGLDSWQMAGAYLLLGKHREVLDYFDFIQASQRADGNIPFAIFRGDKPHPSAKTWLRGMRYPDDVFSFTPKRRMGQKRHSDMQTRRWIGLFHHWQVEANPLSVLGAVSYILTAAEIWKTTKSTNWLNEKLPSINKAGSYLKSRISSNGLVSGAGFYLEAPPRNQWDGVTQCYAVYSFRKLHELNIVAGGTSLWLVDSDKLARKFQELFWRQNHFAEFVHPHFGVVDKNGLSDVNWAAIGLEVANAEQCKILWPLLTGEPEFWPGGMPTQVLPSPANLQPWELPEPVPFTHDKSTFDLAAMGRVWHLEALACLRMKDYERLRESVFKVCLMGRRHGGYWYERYPRTGRNKVKPVGTYGYCEYPSVLIRVVLGNPAIFSNPPA